MSDAHGRSVWDGQRGLGGGDQPCARAWRPGEISRPPASTQGGTMAPHTPVTILLIDDEPGVVRALARLLHRDGYTVDTAADGQHAWAKLHTQRYDVILCDLRLPALDGPALYTRLRQQAPALCPRVIFLTGDTFSTA